MVVTPTTIRSIFIKMCCLSSCQKHCSRHSRLPRHAGAVYYTRDICDRSDGQSRHDCRIDDVIGFESVIGSIIESIIGEKFEHCGIA